MAEERSRIDHERVAKEQRERTEAAERAARERSAEEEEAHRLARERERSAEEERRRREEQARLDGIRTAELELAAIRQATGARTMRLALVATSIATLGSFGVLLWLLLDVHPQRLARLEAEHLSANEGERRRADRAEGLLLESEAARRALEEKLRASDVAPEPAPAAVPPTRKPPRLPPGGKPRPGVKPVPCKDDNDPLNPCL
jgi:hypothetical protein